MKVETALITNNSPYAEVRAVVDNKDDPSMPSSTIRCWFIGIIFSSAVAFINGFFEPRYPAIFVTGNVPQLLAYPVGTFLARVLPDVGFTLFGTRHSLNPGPFNKKEHMLITIMCSAYNSTPYTGWIVWIQYLPQYFNQSWALSFGYQITIALSTGFIGYGFAGLTRRFLVYPTHCVWPSTLVTIALNHAFHTEGNPQVYGPFNKIWKWSRIRFFMYAFGLMFVYYFLPNYLFGALGTFAWMTWIAPNNTILTTITGSQSGMGLNPFPTFDWNIVSANVDPLYLPAFTTFNTFAGAMGSAFIVIGLLFTNSYYTGYFRVNSNLPYDRFGMRYNVTSIVDELGNIDIAKYKEYSLPYLSAGNLTTYICFFAAYSATVTHAILVHRGEITQGFRGFFNSFRKSKKVASEGQEALDVHSRLMREYKEVPEWWFLIVLAISFTIGCVAVAHWPTGTSPAVVLYGLIMCAIFVIPIGIITAMTGTQITLNVLAEFIGGSFVEGSAVGMCFFKTYGYLTCAQALNFAGDLKLGHYVKIPPRVMFFAQMVPTFVSTFVFVGVLQYQIHIDKICTDDAPFRFICPNQNTFFTAAVTWGTIGPKRMFGIGSPYGTTLVGFPIGILITLFFWGLGKKFPRNKTLRSVHPVILIAGGIIWAPYGMNYLWPAVPVAWFSWIYIRKRFLGFWSKVCLSPA